MLKTEKVTLVEKIKKIFDTNQFLIIFHYKGLNVSQMEALRLKMLAVKSEVKVIKNTLASIASVGTKVEVIKDHFVGATAIAWGDNPVTIAKELVEFAKGYKNLSILGGVYNSTNLLADDVVSLSKLPPLEQTQAKLIAVIQTPAMRIARVLQEPASKMVSIFKAYSEKQE